MEGFSIFDPAILRDPYTMYTMLRQRGPVTEIEEMGAWCVTGYEEAAEALRDHETFSSARGAEASPSDLFGGALTMLNADPPDHTRLRGVVARGFTPRAISALQPRIAETTEELLEGLVPGEPYDVVGELAYPLPVIVIAELLGIPTEDRALFKQWSDDAISINETSSADEVARAQASARELRGYFAEIIEQRRRHPSDDLMGGLMRANEEQVVTPEELLAACVLLLVAGNETTTNLISNSVLALSRWPGERARLIDEPELIPNAVEEILRYDGPVQGTLRRTTTDASLGDAAIPAGSQVMVFLAAANRDPSRFPDPDTLDVSRSNASSHVGLGGGIHYCLGAPQARLEGAIALKALLERAPEFTLAQPEEDLEYGPSFFLRGLRRLDVVA